MGAQSAKLIEIRENEQEILKVCERAKEYLAAKHKINITSAPAIATIAYGFLHELFAFIGEEKQPGRDFEINVMQLFDAGVSHRDNDEAEKEGNFTPYLRPGQEMRVMMKDDDVTEE